MLITDPDILDSVSSDQSGLKGCAAGLYRPSDRDDLVSFVRDSIAARRPLLPVGLQSATTGAAVPFGDVVLSMTCMSGLQSIDRARGLAEVLPGTVTGELKRQLEGEGLFYAPDPTSENESTLGGNIASNASGARTFRWGMTAAWVEGLEVVTGTGNVLTFWRRHVDKNTAGYGPFQDPVSLFVGSEGTLGIVTRAWVRLIAHPGPFYGAMLFFPTLDCALDVAASLRSGPLRQLSARCVELFDSAALGLLKSHPKPPPLPANAKAMLYLEFDIRERPLEQRVAEDLGPLEAMGALLDDTVLGEGASEIAWLRDLRHHIPETCNRMAAAFHAAGGLKVSTEFAVPPEAMKGMMQFVEETAAQSGIDVMVRYGHIGNSHPHIFMRGRDAAEVASLRQLAHTWCAQAVALGGTVAGEHGVGKTRRDFLRHMYPAEILAAMRGVKQVMDPHGLLGRGNLFE